MLTHNNEEFIVINRLKNQCSQILERENAFTKMFELGQTDHDVKPVYRDKKNTPFYFSKSEIVEVK